MIPWRGGEWDRCLLGGELVPGLVRVTVTPSRDVQVKPSPGKDAPALVDGGGRGATVKIEVEVWTTRTDHSQLVALAAMLDRVAPSRPGALKEPVKIVHPATAIARVSHVSSLTYTIPPPSGGRLIVPIDAVQWFPEEDTTRPVQTSNTPAGGGAPAPGDDGGSFGSGTVPDPDPDNLGADYP